MCIKVLVVDDELDMQQLIRSQFRRKIKKKEYDFSFASSGSGALDILEARPEQDIILLDINMPGMSGLELLEHIKERQLVLKTIMVTAYENMSNIRAAMNGGAFDFVTKPIDFTDLVITIQKAYAELSQLREGKAALIQLPLTEKELAETDQKAKHLAELDQLKSRFFTNISHEFRTPLTVIRGMTHQLLENPLRWAHRGGPLILRNTDNLLNLVNQILELRKLESGNLQLDLVQGDLIFYTRYLTESFHSMAASKQISLHFESTTEQLMMDFDPEKLMRVISNLLSNAIKFTPEEGRIKVSISVQDSEAYPQPSAVLNVSDTGIGIPEEELPKIFDRFYQADSSDTREGEGTGIGLALSKELVQLMGGSIQVHSTAGAGSNFQILLPITRTGSPIDIEQEKPLAPPVLPVAKSDVEENILAPAPPGELPRLLIVEDNSDVVEYLSAVLEDKYALLLARDGQEGIEIALDQIPDLIITDVMMPRKDGYEVCEILKSDERSSHIPVVMLTAKADHDSKIHGLRKGADAYLPKPFDKEELFVRLEQLLKLRQKIQARYAHGQLSALTPRDEFQQEDLFIQKIRQAVEEHLSDPEFHVPELCRYIGMSRSSLHRKVSALTGDSTTMLMRRIRVEKAYQLLKETDYTIAEIGYMVGFGDPRYFNRTFGKVYGHSPGEVRKQ